MLIRHDRRTLHDILAGTRVVRKSAPAVKIEAGADIDEQPIDDESE